MEVGQNQMHARMASATWCATILHHWEKEPTVLVLPLKTVVGQFDRRLIDGTFNCKFTAGFSIGTIAGTTETSASKTTTTSTTTATKTGRKLLLSFLRVNLSAWHTFDIIFRMPWWIPLQRKRLQILSWRDHISWWNGMWRRSLHTIKLDKWWIQGLRRWLRWKAMRGSKKFVKSSSDNLKYIWARGESESWEGVWGRTYPISEPTGRGIALVW